MKIAQYKVMLDDNHHNALVKEREIEYSQESLTFASPDKIVDMMNKVFQLNEMAEEYGYMLAFNTKMKPIAVFEVSHGASNYTILNPREIYIRALLCGASCIILFHNHPSGDISKSDVDLQTTKAIKEAGTLIGIPLMDHIIVGGDNFYSFRKGELAWE